MPYFYGGVPVSTGIMKCDKRVRPGNPVNCPTFKIKRQQYCCSGCLIGSAAANSAARSPREYRDPRLNVM